MLGEWRLWQYSEMAEVNLKVNEIMIVQLFEFSEEYLKFIMMWEESGEIYNYLSHSRPKCLKEGATELWQTTRLYMINLDNQMVGWLCVA
jgi:hypothetical protein